MKYHIVKACGWDELEDYVNQWLSKGWKLHGNTFYSPEYNKWFQPMIYTSKGYQYEI